MPLTAEPPEAHPAYDRLNATLNGRFAESAYRLALERGDPKLNEYRRALSMAPLNRLAISFQQCKQFRNEARLFTKALPVSLEYLDLDLGSVGFEASHEFAIGLGRLVKLKYLKLELALSDAENLWNELERLCCLKELDLNLRCCSDLTSVDGLGRAVSALPRLHSLSINLSGIQNVFRASVLQNSASMLPSALQKGLPYASAVCLFLKT